jgi:hypothetical protein
MPPQLSEILPMYPVDRVLGGVPGYTQAASNSGGNLISLALPSDLVAGRTEYRKMSFRVAAADNSSLVESFLRMWDQVSGAYAYASWFPCSRRLLNSEITGSEEKYGAGVLKFAVASTDTTIVVSVRHSSLASGADAIFAAGKKIAVCLASQGPTADTALQSYAVVSGAPSVAGLDVTINLAAPIGAAYAAGSRVQSYPTPVDIKTAYANVVKTSASGVFTAASMVLDNIGTPTCSVAGTFTSATTFTATCDFPGGVVTAGSSALGTGSITAAFAPVNRFNSRPVLTLPVGIFSGTWASGDTVEFDLDSADYCLMVKHVVPAAAASVAGDFFDLAYQGGAV